MSRLTVKESKQAGSVTDTNTKMPGSTFALSAKKCNVGGRLVTVKGSVCDKCYALRLQNFRPNVDAAWERNFEASTKMIASDPDRWVKWVSFQINRLYEKSDEPYHRWFDSGDLPNLDFLLAICEVAKATEPIRHWLPTRELQIVRTFYRRGYVEPENLIIRASSPMIDDKPLSGFIFTSTVHRKTSEYIGKECDAYTRSNSCGPCRACWSKNVPNVSYPLH